MQNYRRNYGTRIAADHSFWWRKDAMPAPRSRKGGSRKKGQRKLLSTWKKKITAEAGRRLRAKSGDTVPDTSSIPWM
jgi:hypothetical protein